MSFDPFAEFASFSTPAPAAQPAPVPAASEEKKQIMNSTPQPMMQQQQPMQQQPMQQNPFGGGMYGQAPQQQPMGMMGMGGMMGQQPMVPVQQQPSNQWSMQQQPPMGQPQQQQPQMQGFGMASPPPAAPMGQNPSFGSPFGQQPPAPPAPPVPSQQPPAPAPPATNNEMNFGSPVPSSNMSQMSGGYMSNAPPAPPVPPPPAPPVPPQQTEQNPYMQQMNSTVSPPQQGFPPQSPTSPVFQNAPAAVVQEDDDFFGDFSNSVQEKSPSRPPSVFEANQNDDVSYLSKSTGGGGVESAKTGSAAFDDPKFAPKPRNIAGLEQSRGLSQNAPPGASPLPDFDQVHHSGYVLARISFRTILIKKWKQCFWVTYGTNQILFFRSSSDFEDWLTNPYLSQPQRDFLVKLKVDFEGDMFKQGVRGYQVTTQRLKNYNNRMLHQFKLERWMEYGPTIAAAFASPNERETFNLRTIISEMIKMATARNGPAQHGGHHGHAHGHHAPSPQQNGYGQQPPQQQFSYEQQGRPATAQSNYDYQQQAPDPVAFAIQSQDNSNRQHFSSSASMGRLDYGRGNGGGSVYSSQSHRSYGVMSSGPVERRSNANEYIGGGYQY